MQHTNSPYHRPEIGQKLADKENREGVAERVLEPAVHKSIAVDLTLIGPYDRRLTDLVLDLVQTATAHDAQTFYRRRSLPGVGKILALVLLDAIHNLHRLPRVQAFVFYCHLVTCAQDSAGNCSGPAGQKIGKASLQGAFSAAAVLFLRNTPAGQQYRTRMVKKHGTGKALTVLTHQLVLAV